jgi:hypothetical protein
MSRIMIISGSGIFLFYYDFYVFVGCLSSGDVEDFALLDSSKIFCLIFVI